MLRWTLGWRAAAQHQLVAAVVTLFLALLGVGWSLRHLLHFYYRRTAKSVAAVGASQLKELREAQRRRQGSLLATRGAGPEAQPAQGRPVQGSDAADADESWKQAVATCPASELHLLGPTERQAHRFFEHDDTAQDLTLVTCYVCYGTLGGRRAMCCEVCGVGVHHKCLKKVPADCKPVSIVSAELLTDATGPAAKEEVTGPPRLAPPPMGHHWLPDGCIIEGVEQSMVPEIRMCMACQEPCGGAQAGLALSIAPSWTCAWCQVSIHPSCYLEALRARIQGACCVQEAATGDERNGAGLRAGTEADSVAVANNAPLQDQEGSSGEEGAYVRRTPGGLPVMGGRSDEQEGRSAGTGGGQGLFAQGTAGSASNHGMQSRDESVVQHSDSEDSDGASTRAEQAAPLPLAQVVSSPSKSPLPSWVGSLTAGARQRLQWALSWERRAAQESGPQAGLAAIVEASEDASDATLSPHARKGSAGMGAAVGTRRLGTASTSELTGDARPRHKLPELSMSFSTSARVPELPRQAEQGRGARPSQGRPPAVVLEEEEFGSPAASVADDASSALSSGSSSAPSRLLVAGHRRTRSHGEGLGQLLRSPGQAMSLAAALDPSANASGPGTLAAAIHRLSHAQTPGTSRFGTLPLPQRRGSTLAASHARNRSVGSAHLGLKRFASRGSMSDLAFAGSAAMLPALAAEAVGPVDPLVCSIGPHARLVLPPSSVEVVPRSRERARDVVARMVESTVEKGLKSLQLTTNYLKKQVAEQDWLQSLSTPLVTGRLLAPSWGGARDAGAAPRATAAGDTWQAPADSAGRDTARLPEPWSPPMSPSQTVSRAARADGAAMPAELVADALARQSSTASMDGGPEPSQSRPALAVSATGEDARGVRVAERAGARPAEFQVKAVPPGFKPLLVFLNTKSGPQVGASLKRRFLKLLNPLQVVMLPAEKPEPALRLFRDVEDLRILVVGGDGTVGWVLGAVHKVFTEEAGAEGDASLPPVAVLPLGTGNDLARCLEWGSGVAGFKQRGLPAVLRDVEFAAVAMLDRWTAHFTPRTTAAGPKAGRDSESDKVVQFNNYLGIGIDAKVALDFHSMREAHPRWFMSQVGNKVWYGTLGATDLLARACSHLPQSVKLTVDGRPVPVPSDLEGIVVLNIASHMGGVDLWASALGGAASAGGATAVGTPRSGPPTALGAGPSEPLLPQLLDDGLIEVVGVKSTVHLGQIQLGLSRAVPIAQGTGVHIETTAPLPVQVDGEPWLLPPSHVRIDFHCQAPVLRRPRSGPAGLVAAAVSEVLVAAESLQVISCDQRRELAAAIAMRVAPLI